VPAVFLPRRLTKASAASGTAAYGRGATNKNPTIAPSNIVRDQIVFTVVPPLTGGSARATACVRTRLTARRGGAQRARGTTSSSARVASSVSLECSSAG
jgi:hypothetical protein